MSREFNYMRNPWPTRLGWSGTYVLLAIIGLVVLSFVLNSIKTRELPTGGVTLTTQYSRYLVGEPISFVLTNNYNSKIYVLNKCPAEPLAVYRQDNNKWVRIHDKTSQVCNAENRQVEVPSQKSVSMSLAQWPHLFDQPGKYRLVFLVEYYNALPYQDIEIVAAPVIASTSTNSSPASTSSGGTRSSGGTTSTGSNTSGGATPTPRPAVPPPSPTPSPTPTPTPASAPVTYTEHVSSAGNYTTLSYTIKVGDSINFIYDTPRTQEVRTRFTSIGGAPAVASVTVDSEFTHRSRTFTAAGSYTFKADDHSGNRVTLTVQ